MMLWSNLILRFRSLVRDQAGGVLPLVGGGMIMLVAAVGLATDTARGYMAKARLSQALDAAALAGGQVMYSATRDADIQMYFDANFPDGFLDSTVSGLNISVSEDNATLTLAATATIPTTFMRLIGKDSMQISASTEVTRAIKLLDVVLAIDMSGSMSWGVDGGSDRISVAREAAKELVDILFGDEAIKDNLKIGLVPWNGKVNVMLNGTTFDSAQTVTNNVSSYTNPWTETTQSTTYTVNNSPVTLFSAPPDDWQGCVYSRYPVSANPDDVADVILADTTTGLGDWIAWQPIGPEGEPSSSGYSKKKSGGGGGGGSGCSICTACVNHGITALQSTRAAIDAAIDELVSPSGVTNITQGLAWGWRVLVPTAPFTEADANPPFTRQQALILLTDGENYGGEGDGYQEQFGSGTSAGPAGMDARLTTLAANIKATGVEIYTIQFANSGGALQTLMQTGATSSEAPFYNYAPDAASLQEVFQEVANHLSELRISQ